MQFPEHMHQQSQASQVAGNYSTIQPKYGATQVDNRQTQQHQFGVIPTTPKVPPLAFNSAFNLAEAPLMRMPQQQPSPDGSQPLLSQDNGGPGQYFMSGQQMLTTEFDAPKRPPVTVKQLDVLFMPNRGASDAVLMYDVCPQKKPVDLESNSNGGPNVYGSEFDDLVLLSRQEASVTNRKTLKGEGLEMTRVPLGSAYFQDLIKGGVHATCTSPDERLIAILTLKFTVVIYDKQLDMTQQTEPIDPSFFRSQQATLESLLDHDTTARDKFSLYMSDGATVLFVISASQRLVLTWTQSNSKLSQAVKKETVKKSLVKIRSNSAQKVKKNDKKAQMKDFFDQHQERDIESKTNQDSAHVQDTAPESLRGHWTNITVHSPNKIEQCLKALVSSVVVQFNQSVEQETFFGTGLPTRLGLSKRINGVSEIQEEGSLISVKMYDWATFQNIFDSAFYSDLTNEQSPRTFKRHKLNLSAGLKRENEELDTDTRKVLVFSQQSIKHDKIFKGNVWYQNPYYLVEKITFATEIEYMGLLPDNSSNRNLLSRCDNQGNLVAVAVNSVHKIYCQIMFVSMKNQFVSLMNLFEFVGADDSPPFDIRGKTNLQVDDLAWTRNDAFLILMFNTGALAVLPRLGSQLLKIYNPTICNVRDMNGALANQYKMPRGFNELILQGEFAAQVKQQGKSQLPTTTSKGVVCQKESTGYRIQMHPTEEAFVVYNGSVAYLMQLELEPELQELFNDENKSYFFMRFCFSMKALSKDQETLSKIPQLLTSKLPICEFDKNQDKLENETTENIGKRIQTASQINPWQMENRRMDTIQSFDADFNEESEVVLLNFKHLLFSYRWNAATTINYLEWLITVTNDIFYYFLKQSEPMYAYHALKISEYYMKNVLAKTKTVNQYQPMSKHKTHLLREMSSQSCYTLKVQERPGQLSKDSFDRTSRMFKGLYERMMNPVIEIYTHGLASKTLQAEVATDADETAALQRDLKHLVEQPKALSDKIKDTVDYIGKTPLLISEGDGNTGFSFQKNYILLAYYCLIQFRNYQASNFNILFLILSSYIVKNHVNASFIDSLQRFTCVIIENFQLLDKTDELDLFFGRCGRNLIRDAPTGVQFLQKWIELVTPYQSSYSFKVLNKKSLHAIQAHNYAHLMQLPRPTGEVNPAEVVRPEVQPMLDIFYALESLDYRLSIDALAKIAQTFAANKGRDYLITPTQVFGISLTVFANSMFHLVQGSERAIQTLTAIKALDCVSRQAIKMDKKSPINTVSEHTKIYDNAFGYHKSLDDTLKARTQLMKLLKVKDLTGLKKMTAMMLAYTGDLQRPAQLLKSSKTGAQSINLLLFNILLQGSSLKQHSKNFLHLRDVLQDYSMKNVKDFTSLHQTTERLNAMHAIKFSLAELSSSMQRLTTLASNSFNYREYLWAAFALMPLSCQVIFKEQVARDSLTNAKSILAFQVKNDKESDGFPLKLVLADHPLAQCFFEKTLEGNCQHLEYILPAQTVIRRRFFHQIELILICFYDQHRLQVIFATCDMIRTKSEARTESSGIQELATERVISLFMKDFRKFVKMFTYLKIRTDMRAMDQQAQQCRQTNPVKAIESQIMICCKSLQHMVHFPQYTNVQAHVRRALALLTHHLFHIGDVISLEVRQKILLPVIGMIQYHKLGRQNKQILSGILEKCKSLSNVDYEPIIHQLESTIFDRSMLNPLADINPSSKFRQQTKKAVEPETADAAEFRKMIEEVMGWLRYTILPSIPFYKQNVRGHRRAVDAMVDLCEYGVAMKATLGLPMTACSLFYRGINFEVKHMNVFGLDDSVLAIYSAKRDLDRYKTTYQEQARRLAEAGVDGEARELAMASLRKAYRKMPYDEATHADLIDLEEKPAHLARAFQFAEQQIIQGLKSITVMPAMELDIFCKNQTQLFDLPEMPRNIDLSDVHTINGSGTLHQESALMQERASQKKQLQEEEAKAMMLASQIKATAATEASSVPGESDAKRNSLTQQPLAFSNSFSLADPGTAPTQTTSQVDSSAASAPVDSTKKQSVRDQMARFRLQAGPRRTVRKNSAKRRVVPDAFNRNIPTSPKYVFGQGIRKQAEERKAKVSKIMASQANESAADGPKETTQAQVGLRPFSLVYLRKKGTKEAPEYEVKMPFKEITEKIARQRISDKSAAPVLPQEQSGASKVKPFEIQHVKVVTQKEGMAGTGPPVKVVRNMQQECVENSRFFKKQDLVKAMVAKLHKIRSATDAVSKKLHAMPTTMTEAERKVQEEERKAD